MRYIFLVSLFVLASCTVMPPATPTATPTDVPTATPTDVPTATPTATPTDVPTATPAPLILNYNPSLNPPYRGGVLGDRVVAVPEGFKYAGQPVNVTCGLGACRFDIAWFNGLMGYESSLAYLLLPQYTYLIKLQYEVGCFSNKYNIDENSLYLTAVVGDQILDFRTVNDSREALWTFKVVEPKALKFTAGVYIPYGVCEQHSFITFRYISLETLPEGYQTIPTIIGG